MQPRSRTYLWSFRSLLHKEGELIWFWIGSHEEYNALIKKLGSSMSDVSKNIEPSVCASCGETSGCGAKLDGCWCNEVTLSEEITAEIAKNFDGCLCPKCLNAFAARPSNVNWEDVRDL